MRTPVAAIAVIALALAASGCDTTALLIANGAIAAVTLGTAGIVAATTDERTSYCKTGAGQIYVHSGPCDAADQEIRSEEYQSLYRQQADAQTRATIAANETARTAKTYCRGSLSNTPYIAPSGTCQAGDQTISESEYQAAKADLARLTAPPLKS